jgi:hypothetical protein
VSDSADEDLVQFLCHAHSRLSQRQRVGPLLDLRVMRGILWEPRIGLVASLGVC